MELAVLRDCVDNRISEAKQTAGLQQLGVMALVIQGDRCVIHRRLLFAYVDHALRHAPAKPHRDDFGTEHVEPHFVVGLDIGLEDRRAGQPCAWGSYEPRAADNTGGDDRAF